MSSGVAAKRPEQARYVPPAARRAEPSTTRRVSAKPLKERQAVRNDSHRGIHSNRAESNTKQRASEGLNDRVQSGNQRVDAANDPNNTSARRPDKAVRDNRGERQYNENRGATHIEGNYYDYGGYQGHRSEPGRKPRRNEDEQRERTGGGRYGAKHAPNKPGENKPSSRYYTKDYLEKSHSGEFPTSDLESVNASSSVLKDVSPTAEGVKIEPMDKPSASEKKHSMEASSRVDEPEFDCEVKTTRRVRSNNAESSKSSANHKTWEFTPTNRQLHLDTDLSAQDIAKYIGPQKSAGNDNEPEMSAPTARRVKATRPQTLHQTEATSQQMLTESESQYGEMTNKTRRVNKKPTNYASKEMSDDALKLEMQRENPKNRTLYDPANPASSAITSAAVRPKQSPKSSPIKISDPPQQKSLPKLPTELPQDLYERTAVSSRPDAKDSFRQPPPGRALYDPRSNVPVCNTVASSSFSSTSSAQNQFPGNFFSAPVMGSNQPKPTAQVQPIPSNNTPPPVQTTYSNMDPISSAAQQSAPNQQQQQFLDYNNFVQIMQMNGITTDLASASPNIVALFGQFMKCINDLQRGGQSTNTPAPLMGNEYNDFLQFLNGGQPQISRQMPIPNWSMPIGQVPSSQSGSSFPFQMPPAAQTRVFQNQIAPVTSTTAASQYQMPVNQNFQLNQSVADNSMEQRYSSAAYPMMANHGQADWRQSEAAMNAFSRTMPENIATVHPTSRSGQNSNYGESNSVTGQYTQNTSNTNATRRGNMELKLEIFPNRPQQVQPQSTNSTSPSPTWTGRDTNDHLSAELQKRIGDMTRKGNIDPAQLVSMQTSNPKMDSIRNKMLQVISMQSVHQTQLIEAKLEELIKKVSLEKLETDIADLRDKFLKECSSVIVSDSESAQTHNIEYILWKTAFYPLIERLRNQKNNTSFKYRAEDLLHKYLKDGIACYNSLLTDLQTVQNINLSMYTTPEMQLRLGHIPKKTRFAMNSAFKLQIGLGDLHRYLENAQGNQDFTLAKQAYTSAHNLQPKNGRAFNQLAIISCQQKRRLETVYYYIRSLAAQEDFKAAKESLNLMFEEVAKKVKGTQQQQQKAIEDKINKQKKDILALYKSRGRLLWVRDTNNAADGMRSHQSSTSASAEDVNELNKQIRSLTASVHKETLMQMEHTEPKFAEWLNKQAVLSSLNIQGILFTGIGLDSFGTLFAQAQEEFRILLSHRPVSMPEDKLLQLITINTFAVYNTAKKDPTNAAGDTSSKRDGGASQQSDANKAAVVFGLMTVHTMVDQVVAVLSSYPGSVLSLHEVKSRSQEEQEAKQALRTLLPPIKLWSAWMLNNVKSWFPIPESSANFDPYSFWTSWATMINLIDTKIDPQQFKFSMEASEDQPQILILPEIVSVAGYKPMNWTSNSVGDSPIYVNRDCNEAAILDAYRCFCMMKFADFLENEVKVIHKVQAGVGESEYMEYEACLPELRTPVKFSWADEIEAAETVSRHSRANTESSDDGLLADLETTLSNFDMTSTGGGTAPGQSLDSNDVSNRQSMSELQIEKQRLESQHEQSLRIQESKENYLSASSELMRIEPLYIVIDTNAFIDHLNLVQRITDAKKYQVIVPLTVVGELDDLSKRKEQNPGVWKSGSAPKPTKLDLSRLALPANEHDKSKRAENSLKALQYIEVAMMDKRNCFMVKTSKGVLAHSTKIRNLFDGQNDDAIIATALCQIPSDHNEPIRAPDGSIYVKREVVLLTDDRNLILKSIYVNSLPATSIQEFVKLYNLNS
ncbi:uncharacterized protein LOC142342648 isoform X3 [Convolutriloba macropyga]|uniref:uncharacterized protein LOC142342648 isoform X3 n=1 Tax=Convolutriloba macropyga TaxID=536237 RepID=UPI003F5221F9